MRCGDCLFWRNGTCHLRPPEVFMVTTYTTNSYSNSGVYTTNYQPSCQFPSTYWPITDQEHFCGEFYPNTAPRPKRYRELVAEIDDAVDRPAR